MRITREDWLAKQVKLTAERSTCNRRQVGALIVSNGRILVNGYVGAPSGFPHCLEVGCELGNDGGCVRTIHAEANVIAFAARHGLCVEGAELWCSLTPCLMCAKLIINSGIKRFIALEPYRYRAGADLLEKANIEVILMEPTQ